MEVRTLLKRGADHHVNCEDDLFTFKDGNTYIGAVFDGCSTGIKSHFVSTLYNKILNAYCNNLFPIYKEWSLEGIGRSIFKSLYHSLNEVKTSLYLDPLELLSTVILTVIRDGRVFVLVSGDGCFYISDGKSAEETKIESPGNAPDYLAYHLNSIEEALLSTKEYTFEMQKTFSICSDGIYSFTDKEKKDVSSRVIESLLYEETLIKSEAMLARKYNMLLKEGYSNYDDLSIVRFIL